MTPKERMEQILGGKITPHNEQPLPGVAVVEGTQVYYVSDVAGVELGDQLHALLERVKPPHIKHGGAVATKHALRVPNGDLFHAIKCRGDLAGWKQQIDEGAELLGLTIGLIESGDSFVTSSGKRFRLNECEHVRL